MGHFDPESFEGLVLSQLSDLRSKQDEMQMRQVNLGEDVSAVKAQMKSLLGNGNPGIIQQQKETLDLVDTRVRTIEMGCAACRAMEVKTEKRAASHRQVWLAMGTAGIALVGQFWKSAGPAIHGFLSNIFH